MNFEIDSLQRNCRNCKLKMLLIANEEGKFNVELQRIWRAPQYDAALLKHDRDGFLKLLILWQAQASTMTSSTTGIKEQMLEWQFSWRTQSCFTAW